MTDPVIPVAPREDELLATAIVNVAKRLGITEATTPMTGPEVLLLLQEIEVLAAAPVPCAASPADEELAIAMLAACEATIRHLWDIAARFDTKQCNLIRDEIHQLNTITLPAIQDLRATGEGARDEGLQTATDVALVPAAVRATDADSDLRAAAPVAVSLPSEEIERAAWCGNSVYHDEWEQGRYDDRCGACRRSRNAIELLLARLRGEATVRPEDWRADYDEAKGYLSRLFLHCAPQCTLLPTLAGIATQIDNYIAGLREKVNEKPRAHVPATVRVEE